MKCGETYSVCNKEIYSHLLYEEDIHNQDNRRRLWQSKIVEKKSTELIKRRISKLPV